MKSNPQQSSVRRWRRRAIALIWTALCGLTFIGFVGLAMDTAYILTAGEQLQAIADAASLAAARAVKANIATARTYAVDIAARNSIYGIAFTLQRNDNNANSTNGDIIIGQFDRNAQTFTATESSPNAVRVVAKRATGSGNGPLPLIFARGFGVNNSNVTRDAIAMVNTDPIPGLLVLDPNAANAFDKSGSGILDVVSTDNNCGGTVQVNSDNATAARSTAGTIKTTSFQVNGGASTAGTTFTDPCQGSSNLVHALTGKIMTDLLLYLQSNEPSIGSLTARTVPAGATIVLDPGFYATGISRAAGSVTLKPGLYYLDGVGLNITGTTAFCAHGVCLFIKGAAARVNLTSTSAKSISPIDINTSVSCNGVTYPSAMGANAIYQGVCIFQSAGNANAATIAGTSSMDNLGVFYFPGAAVNISASGTPPHFINQLTAKKVVMTGTGTINIRFDGQQEGEFQGQFPGRFPVGPTTRVFLVE